MKDAGFIASTKIILKKPLPTPGEGGSLSRSGLSSLPLSAVCHAGLRVPAPPILELPSLFVSPYSFNCPLLLDFLSTRWSAFYTQTHIHMSFSPALSSPHHWAPTSQLGGRFQHDAACFFFVPHFPFLVVMLLKEDPHPPWIYGTADRYCFSQ